MPRKKPFQHLISFFPFISTKGAQTWSLIFLLSLFFVTWAPGPVLGQDRYFVLVFASQSSPRIPRYTHTFATLIRIPERKAPQEPFCLQVFTISWLPESMEICPWRLLPEPGVNVDLISTLEWAFQSDQRVVMWGPYEVKEDYAHHFLEKRISLEQGKEKYRTIDPFFFRHVSNCIHAVKETDLGLNQSRDPLIRFGVASGRHIVTMLYRKRFVVPSGLDHSWIVPLLGLDGYPIEHRRHWLPALKKWFQG